MIREDLQMKSTMLKLNWSSLSFQKNISHHILQSVCLFLNAILIPTPKTRALNSRFYPPVSFEASICWRRYTLEEIPGKRIMMKPIHSCLGWSIIDNWLNFSLQQLTSLIIFFFCLFSNTWGSRETLRVFHVHHY